MVSSGQIVAKMLKQEGIKHIFTISGGHIVDIYNGCIDEGIEIIDVRHEQVAAHAADAYARITGLGCAVVTAGPGTTDAVTGMANAFRAESPMLLIGGNSPLKQYRMGGLQELRHTEMMTPISKVRIAGDDHRARGGNDGHRFPRDVQRRARARASWKFRTTSWTARSRRPRCAIPRISACAARMADRRISSATPTSCSRSRTCSPTPSARWRCSARRRAPAARMTPSTGSRGISTCRST